MDSNPTPATYTSASLQDMHTGLNSTDFNDLEDDSLQITGDDKLISDDDIHQGAALQIQEVESELDAILTPTPMELHKLMLNKMDDCDFGLSLSDGVYEKGVYISALRPGGPAQRAGVKPFDKILQVAICLYLITNWHFNNNSRRL